MGQQGGLSASVNTASGEEAGQGAGGGGAGVGHQTLEGLSLRAAVSFPRLSAGTVAPGSDPASGWVLLVTWGHKSKAEAVGGPSARTSALPPYLTAALDTPSQAASWQP